MHRKRNACAVTATPATEIPTTLADARLLHAIHSRRSWKPAAIDPNRTVPDSLWGALLDAACQAPTHGLIEPWRFVVFTGPARARLATHLPAVYDAVTPPELFRADKRDTLTRVFLEVPVVIVLACHHPPGCKIPLLENQLAVACAVQNLHLAAHAAGLAGMWSSPPLLQADAARPILELDDHSHALGIFYLGWPRPQAVRPTSTRRPWTEKTRWVQH
jgi:nitroreductase